MRMETAVELEEAGDRRTVSLYDNTSTPAAQAEAEAEEEETVELVGADEAAGKHERRLRVVAVTLSVLVFCSLVALLGVSLAQRTDVLRFNHDFTVSTRLMFSLSAFSETVKRGFLSVQMHASPQQYNTTQLWTDSYHQYDTTLSDTAQQSLEALSHKHADYSDTVIEEANAAVSATTILRPVFGEAFALLEAGDAAEASSVVQSSEVALGLGRVFEDLIAVSQSLSTASTDRQQSGVKRLDSVMVVCLVFTVLVLAGCVLLGCMVCRQRSLNAKVSELLLKSEQRCVREYSRSSQSASADSDSQYDTPESESKRTFRLSRLLMAIFAVLFILLTLSAYSLVATCMSQGADAFGNSTQLELLSSLRQVPGSLGLYSILAHFIAFSDLPLPGLQWIPVSMHALQYSTILLETISCGSLDVDADTILQCDFSSSSTSPPATTAPNATVDEIITGAFGDINAACVVASTPELQEQSTTLLRSMLAQIAIEVYSTLTVAGIPLNTTWVRSDPEVTAVYGTPTPGTEDESVRCFSCIDAWERDSDLCTDEFLAHVWHVDESRATPDNALFADSVLASAGTTQGLLPNITTDALVDSVRSNYTSEGLFEFYEDINAQIQQFIHDLNAQHIKETDDVESWTWVAVWAIAGSLVGIIVSWVVLIAQDRKRRKVQAYVRQEQEWSLNRILSYQPTAALFRVFAKKSFTEENVDFWQQAQACKRHNWPVSDSLELYEEFIKEGSSREINIPSSHRRTIAEFMEPMLGNTTAAAHLHNTTQKLDKGQAKAMRTAQHNIWDLMAVNLYHHFLRDPHFQEYLQQRHELFEKKFNILQRR